MEQLRPGEQQPLIWQQSNPNDNTVYFPVVTVYNGLTQAVLATINLTAVAGVTGMYQGKYQVPYDSSGLGFWITQTLRVYDDSGHTTLDANYNVENRTYLVQERINFNLGGNYGTGINYKKVEEAIVKHKYKPEKDNRIEILGQSLKTLQRAVFERLQLMDEQHSEQFNGIFDQINQLAKMHASMSASISGVDKKMLPGSIVDTLGEHDKKFTALAEMLSKVGRHIHDSVHSKMDAHRKETAGLMDSYHKQHVKEIKDHGEKVVKDVEDLLAPIDTIVVKKGRDLKQGSGRQQKPDYLRMANKLLS